MAKTSQRLMLQHRRVLSIKNVQLLFVSVFAQLFTGLLTCESLVLLVLDWVTGDIGDLANSSSPISSSGCHLLMHLQGVFFKLVNVFEFSFELPHHKHLLRVGLDVEGVSRVVPEVFSLVLVQAESRQAAQVRVVRQLAARVEAALIAGDLGAVQWVESTCRNT